MGSIETGLGSNLRMPARSGPIQVLTVSVGLVLVLSGCSSAASELAGPATAPALTRITGGLGGFYAIPSPLPPGPPGSLIRLARMATGGSLPSGASAYRILYHSETAAGADVAVSGMVVLPGGTPPAGGSRS